MMELCCVRSSFFVLQNSPHPARQPLIAFPPSMATSPTRFRRDHPVIVAIVAQIVGGRYDILDLGLIELRHQYYPILDNTFGLGEGNEDRNKRFAAAWGRYKKQIRSQIKIQIMSNNNPNFTFGTGGSYHYGTPTPQPRNIFPSATPSGHASMPRSIDVSGSATVPASPMSHGSVLSHASAITEASNPVVGQQLPKVMTVPGGRIHTCLEQMRENIHADNQYALTSPLRRQDQQDLFIAQQVLLEAELAGGPAPYPQNTWVLFQMDNGTILVVTVLSQYDLAYTVKDKNDVEKGNIPHHKLTPTTFQFGDTVKPKFSLSQTTGSGRINSVVLDGSGKQIYTMEGDNNNYPVDMLEAA